ncbi:MAG TPA: hypothetical protein VJ111_02400 [Chitinophagaceae bacterium]|nr:hypothetical protein [Chitinophagaceae bacterium]
MRNKLKFHHLLLIGALVLGSCQKEYVKPEPIPPPNPSTPISFANDIYPNISGTTCGGGCHDGSIPPDLSSQSVAYNSLITGIASSSNAPHAGKPFIDTANAASSVLYVRLIDANAGSSIMPPAGALSLSYAEKVKTWIQQGAKNN